MGGEIYDAYHLPRVSAFAALDGRLYMGGSFTTAGGILVNRVASWNLGTSAWSTLGSGVSGYAWPEAASLAVLGGKVYVGGDFLEVGGESIGDIACWDPAVFDVVDSGIGGE